MKFKLALILCSICLVVNISYAGYFEDDFLESIKLVDENGGNGDGHISGRKISTYEDVDDLVIKPKSTLNAEFINYADIPSGPTLETKAEKILERFDKANYTVVSKRIKNINKFFRNILIVTIILILCEIPFISFLQMQIY